MVDQRPRLTLWGDGAYMLSSDGADGSSAMLSVQPDGVVVASTITPLGRKEILHLAVEESSVPQWVRVASTDLGAISYRTSRGWDAPWIVGPPVVRPDGTRHDIGRWTDGKGSWWERGFDPAHSSGDRSVGDNSWVRVWHDPVRVPGGGTTRESFQWGNEVYKGTHTTSRTSYSQTRVVERDSHGHVTRDTSVYGGYNHADRSSDRQVLIRYPDGSWVRQVHHTGNDGHWQDWTTTRDKDGHMVTRTSTGTGDRTETYKEERKEATPEDDPPPEPDPPEKDSPTGDGTGGGAEGDPAGPLSGVGIRDLLGQDWEGPEDVDSLGDLDAMMRPWLDRIRAALASGGGAVAPGELVDSLGAPPDIMVDLSGYGPDEFADHDSLGRPPPILRTPLDVVSATTGRTPAPSVAELLSAAGPFADSAAAAAKSVTVLRNR